MAELFQRDRSVILRHSGNVFEEGGPTPRKADVAIAKNYLDVDELDALNKIVMAYLDFAEVQALNRPPMYMVD